jgi:hypothetical protein
MMQEEPEGFGACSSALSDAYKDEWFEMLFAFHSDFVRLGHSHGLAIALPPWVMANKVG